MPCGFICHHAERRDVPSGNTFGGSGEDRATNSEWEIMSMRKVIFAGFAALGMGVLAASASAAPLSGIATAKPEATETSAVEKISYRYVRECGWRHGHRTCWYARVWTPAPVFSFYAGPRHSYGFYGRGHGRRWY
jgi:hypothetical protein